MHYTLGSASRSFVVGFGQNPPLRVGWGWGRAVQLAAIRPSESSSADADADASPPLPCLSAAAPPRRFLPQPPRRLRPSPVQRPGPNPPVLFGARGAGPAGPGDDTYRDARDDYVSNEVAIDYNAGWTGALAGLLHLAA